MARPVGPLPFFGCLLFLSRLGQLASMQRGNVSLKTESEKPQRRMYEIVFSSIQWCLDLVYSDLADCRDLVPYFCLHTSDRNGKIISYGWFHLMDYLVDLFWWRTESTKSGDHYTLYLVSIEACHTSDKLLSVFFLTFDTVRTRRKGTVGLD